MAKDNGQQGNGNTSSTGTTTAIGPSIVIKGKLVQGLCPDTQFYAFVVYTDAAGKTSKPSPAFPFVLKNRFVYK